jgi:hypothetical protein
MKSLIITIVIIISILMIVFLVGKPKNSNLFQTAFARDTVATKTAVPNTIDSLEDANWYISHNHCIPIGFVEGQDSFRIVADTGCELSYIQRKIDFNNWETLKHGFDMISQGMVKLTDWNDDGFIDLYWNNKWYAEVTLYNPETKVFIGPGTVEKCQRYSLPDKVQYNVYFSNHFQTTWSCLYKYKKLDNSEYAKLKVISEEGNIDFEDKPIKTVIELYSVKGNNDSLIQKWELSDFPAFMKDGYFDADDFIKDYWTKNWKRFVTN